MHRKNELKLQKEIKDSAFALGGFGHKMSSKMQVGVLDMLVVLPNFASAWYLEVKDLGEVKPGFCRSPGWSAKQIHEMQKIEQIRRQSVEHVPLRTGGLVGYWLDNVRYMQYVPPEATGSPVCEAGTRAIVRQTGCLWQLNQLLEPWTT